MTIRDYDWGDTFADQSARMTVHFEPAHTAETAAVLRVMRQSGRTSPLVPFLNGELTEADAEDIDTYAVGRSVTLELPEHDPTDGYARMRADIRRVDDWHTVLELEARAPLPSTSGRRSDLQLRLSAGKVCLDEVGQTAIETFSGDVTVDTIHGPAEIRADHGQVRVGNALARCTVHTGLLGGVDFTGTPPPRLEVKQGEGTVTCRTAQAGIVELPAGHWAFADDELQWLGPNYDVTSSPAPRRPRLAAVQRWRRD